jgi:predicted SAM-dependent methyltransferase
VASSRRVIMENQWPEPCGSALDAGLYVQYGCGNCAPEGWMNFDASYTLVFERLPVIGGLYTKNRRRFPDRVLYGDIVKGLPIAAGSASAVYASHILEHLAYSDCLQALRNTYRLLRPNGTFRLVVPDLEFAAEQYLAMLKAHSPDATDLFMETTALGRKDRPRNIVSLVYSWLNGSTHLWMWDYPTMRRALEAQGFGHIRRCLFNDSEDPMFARVEDFQRFDGALAIEARR